MKFCYTVQSDNTLMDFGYDSTWKLLKIHQVYLGSKVVIELYKITSKSTCSRASISDKLFVDSNLIQEKYHRKIKKLNRNILFSP